MTQELDLDELRTTYDHPSDRSVIELIDRLEQAERELTAVKSTQVQHIVTTSFATAASAGWAVDQAVKIVSGWLVDDPDRRAREAEAQVGRVREFIAKREGFGFTYVFLENLQTALDGEPSE